MVFNFPSISGRVIHDLKRRSATGIFFYIVNIVVVLLADGYHSRHPGASSLFLILVVTACGIRAAHVVLGSRLPSPRANVAFFVFGILFSALCWGSAFTWMVLQDNEPQTRFFMTICTIALSAGGMISFHPSLGLVVSFVLVMLVPGTVAVLAFTDQVGFGILLILFLAYLIAMTIRTNAEYLEGLRTEELLEKRTRDLEHLCQRDGLTGLQNRRSFDQSLEYEWRMAIRSRTSLTLLICDLDYFKLINDQYGHLAGDAYLRMTARILRQVFQRETDIIARFGGEEFVILLQAMTVDNALKKAEEIRSVIQKTPLVFDGRRILSTISIGVAFQVPEKGEEREALLARADACLYRAKNEGRNRICSAT